MTNNNSNVTYISSRLENQQKQAEQATPAFDGGGGGGYDDSMLKRVEKLESELLAIKTDVAVIRSNYVTKADLHSEINAQTWKLVTFVSGFGAALAAAVFFIARNVH